MSPSFENWSSNWLVQTQREWELYSPNNSVNWGQVSSLADRISADEKWGFCLLWLEIDTLERAEGRLYEALNRATGLEFACLASELDGFRSGRSGESERTDIVRKDFAYEALLWYKNI